MRGEGYLHTCITIIATNATNYNAGSCELSRIVVEWVRLV